MLFCHVNSLASGDGAEMLASNTEARLGMLLFSLVFACGVFIDETVYSKELLCSCELKCLGK